MAKLVAATRQAVGKEIGLAIDCHWNYGVQAAIEMARAVEPYNLLWLEDPVPPENIRAIGVVQRNTSTPIATGENHYFRARFPAPDHRSGPAGAGARRAKDRAVGRTQAGGPRRYALCQSDLAQHQQSRSAPWRAFTLRGDPQLLALEWHAASVPFFDDLVKGDDGPMIRDGKIKVPDRRVGIELDEDVAYKYRKSGEGFFA